ncbi:D-alanine--D-alanyl carrier protein ligase [Seminavis robusta]|uniref:D-alanine--D-alanyl carrier protein ligase n=1 Tax=Seminavis robusta TaxID=568900 RepID=A0A9N8D688_9STRA|nr:D-alanine--D-alanyl carrier protein ligase [Seminavis robusta]|eukprot:Sro11_g008450.1 D-alanine--D-alanyl carrier protein ligase (1396) ;mRNA; f:33065-37338
MKSFSTILESLNHHALETPDKVVFTWVDIKCEEQDRMTFKQLEDQSDAVASRLLKLGCKKGDHVMIAYPFGLEFLAGMFGAMKIGVIPCSIYPPNPNRLKTEMPKFCGFAKDAGAKYALSTSIFAAGMTAASVLYKTGVAWIGTNKLTIKKRNPNKPKEYETFVGEPEGICFIQYTSGSTGCPKGVMISHNNLVEDIWAISRVLGTNAVGALWLPQYHDMGLVSGFMSALYAGVHVIMASPIDFIMRPLLWTDMVETYQATHTCAPNFAYALLLKRLKQANRNANWSHVTHAMFAAEPTQRHVVEELAQTLSIRREHVYNLYGLAEAVVFLTGGPAYPDSDGVVCCGPVDSPSVKLRIVEDGKEVEDGQVGTIWVQSPCVAAGYYGQSQLTASTFANCLPGYEGTWLDTGDLGRVLGGQLYVTGRVKDVIIINGKNYYPTDVELSVDETFGIIIRPGRTTAFQHGDDSIGVTVEGRKDFDISSNVDLAVKIANHVSQVHGLSVTEVVVLKLGVTPKTTSGKLKRSEIRQTTIAGNWKKSSVLLRFQRQANESPFEESSFLEHSFARNGVTSSEFYLSEGTQSEIMRRSMTLPFGNVGLGSVPTRSELQASSPDPNSNRSVDGCGSTNPDDFSIKYANVITSVLGSEVDTSKTWAENGLTSLKSAELRNIVEEVLRVVLPVNFEQLYPTPSELSVFLRASEGKSFPKQIADDHTDFLWNSEISKLSKLQLGAIQTLGFILILVLLFSSLVPSIFLVSWVMDKCGSSQGGGCNGPISWFFLPITFPLFLLSLSVIVVVCKVTVVGKYKHDQFDLLSWDYVRWWFVDRLIDLWEAIVGQFFVGTKYIWIFYRLLGADVAWSAKIESCMREFDLVKVGSNATIGHMINCRKFSQSADSGPKLTFRPILIGNDCTIAGMVSPGAKIGDGSRVEKLSVVEEGAMVPHGVLAKGNPACHAGSFEHTKSEYWEESMLDIFKIVWTIVEAYHFFALSYLVHMTLNQLLPSWRYATLLHWFLLVPGTSFLAILTSIPLKWLLIGKRDPTDEYEGSLWKQGTNWACDFHFRAASWALTPFFGQSKLWNIILYLHGLDVDMESLLNNPYLIFFPSKVDYVKIRQSFVATISLDFVNRRDSKIEIIKSSIGYGVNLHAGAKIMQSVIPPRLDVSDNVYDMNHSAKAWKPSFTMGMLLPELAQLLLNVILFVTLIPSYEIGLAAVKGTPDALSVFVSATAFLLVLILWISLTFVIEKIMLILPRCAQQSLFGVYINHVWIFRVGNWLEMLLYGTPLFPYYAQLMGAEVNGDLWYFGHALYEYSRLHFQGGTIVDSSSLNGHYIDGNGLTVGDTYASGILHPGCFAVAGSVVDREENGPWKVFLTSDGLDSTEDLRRSHSTYHHGENEAL